MKTQAISPYTHSRNNNVSFSHAIIDKKLPRYLYSSGKPFVQDTINALSYLRYYVNGITKKQGYFKINLYMIKDTNNCAVQITNAQNQKFSLVEQFSIHAPKQVKTACKNLRDRMISYRMRGVADFDVLPNDIVKVGRRTKQEATDEKYLLRFKLNSTSFVESLITEKKRKLLAGWIEKP